MNGLDATIESEKKFEFLFGTSTSGCDPNNRDSDTGALLCMYDGSAMVGNTANDWHEELLEDFTDGTKTCPSSLHYDVTPWQAPWLESEPTPTMPSYCGSSTMTAYTNFEDAEDALNARYCIDDEYDTLIEDACEEWTTWRETTQFTAVLEDLIDESLITNEALIF